MKSSGSYGEKFYKVGDESNKKLTSPPKSEKDVFAKQEDQFKAMK